MPYKNKNFSKEDYRTKLTQMGLRSRRQMGKHWGLYATEKVEKFPEATQSAWYLFQ